MVGRVNQELIPTHPVNIPCWSRLEFLGFTMQICSESEWGATSTVLMFMLYWREQMIGNADCYEHEANTYSEHLIHFHDDVSI